MILHPYFNMNFAHCVHMSTTHGRGLTWTWHEAMGKKGARADCGVPPKQETSNAQTSFQWLACQTRGEVVWQVPLARFSQCTQEAESLESVPERGHVRICPTNKNHATVANQHVMGHHHASERGLEHLGSMHHELVPKIREIGLYFFGCFVLFIKQAARNL